MIDIDEATKGHDFHNEIRAERDALRAEAERLAQERDEAIARQLTAEVYVKERFVEAGVYNLRVREKMAEDRATAAERKLVMAVEALNWYADQYCERSKWDEDCGHHHEDVCKGCKARAALDALEKNDG